MITCTRIFTFDSTHRVLGHGGKCRGVHGHGYVAEVSCSAASLNNLGMVIDFSIIKDKVGDWIEKSYDHTSILHKNDPMREELEHDGKSSGAVPYIMPNSENPTAENIAKDILFHTSLLLEPHGIWCTHVRLWETKNCYADATPE